MCMVRTCAQGPQAIKYLFLYRWIIKIGDFGLVTDGELGQKPGDGPYTPGHGAGGIASILTRLVPTPTCHQSSYCRSLTTTRWISSAWDSYSSSCCFLLPLRWNA
eukprot:TRINITY_DN38415_c0_g1_i1.p1 TRINITY_DN38415_c0_g1~~TRINITY_DN38415_c0_g1_i1.p1  ORF type:complete len:105 (+),score=17.18 TRINITY_DN38415_c0_g1_i1:108-422(+)